MLTQDKVREFFVQRIESGLKQTYIARNIGVPSKCCLHLS